MKRYFLAYCSFVFSLLCFTIALTIALTSSAWKKDAIKNNVAEYKCDPKTGATTFCWKTNMVMEK